MSKKDKLSEFLANGQLELFELDGQPSPNVKGAKEHLIKDGEAIPELFIPLFLKHNRNFLKNLPYKDGIPILTKKQKEKYGIVQTEPKKEIKIEPHLYTQESLTEKYNELKKGFKEWAEETFGEQIDRRKSWKNIIVDILQIQEENKE